MWLVKRWDNFQSFGGAFLYICCSYWIGSLASDCYDHEEVREFLFDTAEGGSFLRGFGLTALVQLFFGDHCSTPTFLLMGVAMSMFHYYALQKRENGGGGSSSSGGSSSGSGSGS